MSDTEDWEKIRTTALSDAAAPGWPAHVKSISINGLSLMGLDEDLNLYWDGHLIEINRPLSLSFWQKFGAVATVISAVVAATATAISTYFEICQPF